jgi:hypothetical protein
VSDRIADILDLSLNAALGGESVAVCCGRYPESAAELEPLLKLALSGREALRVDITAEARTAMRERVFGQARQLMDDRRAAISGWSRFWGKRSGTLLKPVALTGALVAMFAGTGVAATGAGPDSVLYPVKQGMEDAREVLAAQTLDKAAVEDGRANERLDEIQSMVDQGKPEYVPDLLRRYEEHMSHAQAMVDEAASQNQDTSEVAAMISATRERHDRLMAAIDGRVPADVEQVIMEDQGTAANGDPGTQGEENENADPGNSGNANSSGDNDHMNSSEGGGQNESGRRSEGSRDSGEAQGSGSQDRHESSNQDEKNDKDQQGDSGQHDSQRDGGR